MSSQLKYFNSTSTGQTNYYILLFDGNSSSVANGGGLTDIDFTWNNTTVRANLIQLVDTSHPGFYFADFLEGVPAGRYTPVVYQAPGADPYTTATTTDTFISRLEPIDWTGTEATNTYTVYSTVQDLAKIIQARD